jgi:hypothetical protein
LINDLGSKKKAAFGGLATHPRPISKPARGEGGMPGASSPGQPRREGALSPWRPPERGRGLPLPISRFRDFKNSRFQDCKASKIKISRLRSPPHRLSTPHPIGFQGRASSPGQPHREGAQGGLWRGGGGSVVLFQDFKIPGFQRIQEFKVVVATS